MTCALSSLSTWHASFESEGASHEPPRWIGQRLAWDGRARGFSLRWSLRSAKGLNGKISQLGLQEWKLRNVSHQRGILGASG